MFLDVVLAAPGRSGSPSGGAIVFASSAAAMVQAILERLGRGGRIERLRILDSFQGPAQQHPLRAVQELGRLKGLFAPGAHVELYTGPGPLPTTAPVALPGVAGFQGGFQGGFGGASVSSGFSGGGFSGGFSGRGTGGTLQAGPAIDLLLLSSVLGVPVGHGSPSGAPAG